MGISTHVYAILGVKIPWDEEFCDAHELVYDDDNVPDLIFDGMSGEYIVLGKILFDSGDFRWGFEKGDIWKTVDNSRFAEIEKNYREEFSRKFPKFTHLLTQPFELHVFLHWS